MTEVTSNNGWQPIETAPKDMMPILVFVPSDWETPCEWHIAFYKPRGKGFVLQDDDHLYCNPTHWQPLTKPQAATTS